MPTLYLTYGPTHSGKSTFGKQLLGQLPNSAKTILVDNDTVEQFVQANFDNLRTDPQVLARRTPEDPDLRLRIPQLIVGYALGEGYDAIVTASHSKGVIRQKYLDIARQHGAQTVLLMFGTSKPEIKRRIEHSSRQGTDAGFHASSYEELLERQAHMLHEPTTEEKAQYASVWQIDEHNSEDVLQQLVASAWLATLACGHVAA
ncbi:MAG TPA: AAA family ATPase [Candidatus Saccharimonadales bacterium]|nr:AAA family ATPase [Candidatus Saccharimonadales bacterium]